MSNGSQAVRTMISGDYQKLQLCFEDFVAAYQKDPKFCVPSRARDIYRDLGNETPVVLLGISQFAQMFLNEAAGRVNVIAVVDDGKAKEGAQYQGIPIITTQALLALAASTPLVAVNACRYDHARRYFKNVTSRANLPMLNFEQALRWLAIHPCTDHRVDDWGGYIARHAQDFVALAQRLDDDYSRVTLYSVLLSHLTCDPEWILNAAKPYLSLYFRSGLWTPGPGERFADCGASIAESTKAFIDATDGVFEKIWMIEPDQVNRKTIGTFIEAYEQGRTDAGSIELLGCALGSEEGEMPFLHEGGHGGHILAVPSDSAICHNVAVRRLDDILDQTPTLIKMDIEGAELDTLKGAQGHILKGKPKMAISAYHRDSDLLDLTRFVEGLRSDYKIGLRHHTEERWDTCLYFY